LMVFWIQNTIKDNYSLKEKYGKTGTVQWEPLTYWINN